MPSIQLSTALKHNYPLPPPAANDPEHDRLMQAAERTTVTGPRYRFHIDDVNSMLFNGVDKWLKNAKLGECALKSYQDNANPIASTDDIAPETVPFPVSAEFVEVALIGGMGPLAGIDMTDKVFKTAQEKSKPATDQKHLPLALHNEAHLITDRTAYFNSFKGDRNDNAAWFAHLTAKTPENPLWGVLELSRRASSAGAHMLASPCNSLHNAYPVFSTESSVPYLHIATSVMYHLSKKYGDRKEPLNILIVGTESTVSGKLYQNKAEEIKSKNYPLPPINWVTPGKEAQKLISDGIYKGVKAGNMPLAAQLIHDGEIRAIEEAQVEGVVVHLRGAFCTEIAPAEKEMTQEQISHFGKTKLLDATQTLAEMMVDGSKALRQANDALDTRAAQELANRTSSISRIAA